MRDLTPSDIINHGHFFQTTLLEVSRFVSYCKDRKIDISFDRLEKFEKLGIFRPILRVVRPEFFVKQRRVLADDGTEHFQEFGTLQDGEIWDGELRKDFAAFIPFDRDSVNSWIDEGLVYMPEASDFKEWSEYTDDEEDNTVFTFYSIFQTLPLHMIVGSLDFKSHIEDIAYRTDDEVLNTHQRYAEHLKGIVKGFSEGENAWIRYALICQLISCRYLPYAESDGVTIAIPSAPFTDFDFFEYRKNWNAKEYCEDLNLTVEDISKAWEGVAYHARHFDPLANWTNLLGLVKKEAKKRLKGDALLCETWRIMAEMLNLFHEDLTGERLYIYGESPDALEVRRGKGITRVDLRYIEYVANEYGVNPRPKLILMVEGYGEFNEISKIAKLFFGRPLSAFRIQVINLKTIGEFNSSKVERFIDHFHDLQTVVYFLLDNENRSKQTRDTLIRKQSQYFPNMTITKDEFFTIWEKSIEFDNFSDVEIAAAMSHVAENRYFFTDCEIHSCREQFAKSGDPLTALYREKLEYGLQKTKLLETLFGYIQNEPKIKLENVEKNRPILDVLFKVRQIALRNFQPTSLDVWTENQNSGWLRDTIKTNV